MGLREITLTNSLNNAPDKFSTKYWLIANLQLSTDLEIPEFFTDETGAPFFRIAKQAAVPLQERSIPIGHYDTPLDLAVSLQYSMTKEQRKIITINYHPAIKRISIKLHSNCYLALPKQYTRLGALLGFPDQDIITPGYHVAPYESLNAYTPLHITLDCIPGQYVGDALLPVLQTVILKGKRDEVVTYQFPNPDFIRISEESLSTIHVRLMLSNGRVAPFQKGAVIVKLIVVQVGVA